MQTLPFQKPGSFYRGNLHSHSTVSDGVLTPEQVVDLYRTQGYDFISLTDHFGEMWDFAIADTTNLRDDDFTTIIGAELHTPGLASGLPWHILAVGLPLDFAATTEGETGPELAQRAADAGAFVGIAHPAWYSLQMDEARNIEAAHAVEIYNETCAALNDRGESWYVADMLLSEGRKLSAFGTDDLHMSMETRPDAFGAWVWVRAESPEPNLLVDALKTGDYYTSQGPKIHDISIAGSEIAISCSPATSVYLTGAARNAYQRHGHGLVEARFPIDIFEGSYCRVTIVDQAGQRAWSNPIWLE
ncbi:MAG: CehA/McbA family metallohydrolase [Thermomicrobiales bacterium]